MALTSYAAITSNGMALTGDVSQASMGGVDVSADHIEVYEFHLGVGTASEGTSARQSGRATHRPLTFCEVTSESAWEAGNGKESAPSNAAWQRSVQGVHQPARRS